MDLRAVILALVASVFIVLQEAPMTKAQQQPAFELPVELVGFPVIIVAVRLSNFVKKLAYSLNPKTYVGRSRRAVDSADMIDMAEAEKRLVTELGENVCIYSRVCLHHAEKASKSLGRSRYSLDWDDIFSHYKSSNEKNKEFYLLSVFLGDIVASPKFCRQLAKRGRQCKD
ncbi:PREDICTED: uncharacterized protein LOC108568757 [Nicrophorus vespilloides]|uniref:Uncharacterized protein LOC108568757 n=1 Tax=Nicrophorus vespilloides TaxID=110193 RepID=A0ABM1NFC0_NICVS|nr:PREDICTED: uncharacterized protein LOC108568757 [Nicrophorus vespilloides]XP_017785521.1 PREDICTED: uncharacterized protein LOC108568757 [Nicrophorus vespilloides]